MLSADVAGAAAATSQAQSAAPARTATAQAAPADEGFLSIQTPADGAGFGWTDDLEVEIVVFADGVGTLVGMTLFVDTVPVSNVSGLQALGDGAYSLAIPWEPSGEGTFILEVVAISNTNRRYDDRVTVTVDPAEEDEEDPEDGEEDPEDGEEDPEADDAGAEEGEDEEDVDEPPTVDLTPTAIDVGTGQSVVVTITNVGEGNLANAPILVSLTRSSDGLVLDEATVVLTLPADRSQVVELPISLTDSLEITVVLDRDNTIPESDESNKHDQRDVRSAVAPGLGVAGPAVAARPDGLRARHEHRRERRRAADRGADRAGRPDRGGAVVRRAGPADAAGDAGPARQRAHRRGAVAVGDRGPGERHRGEQRRQ